MTSEKLASMEPWTFRPSFADSWLSEAFARDTEILTKALHKSLTASQTLKTADSISPFLLNPQTATTPAVSNVSAGSDDQTASKRHRNAIPVVTNAAKVSKRKSRASKRSQTTFITADPANFRQMVQQVTGVEFGSAHLPVAPIVKPEPQRPDGSRLPNAAAGFLPTLDTSAFLLDHHHQQSLVMGPAMSGPAAVGSLSAFESSVVTLVGDGDEIDFDTFASFPTLESWKVM